MSTAARSKKRQTLAGEFSVTRLGKIFFQKQPKLVFGLDIKHYFKYTLISSPFSAVSCCDLEAMKQASLFRKTHQCQRYFKLRLTFRKRFGQHFEKFDLLLFQHLVTLLEMEKEFCTERWNLQSTHPITLFSISE